MTDWLERRREILRAIFEMRPTIDGGTQPVKNLLEENRRLREDRDALVEFTMQYMVGAGVLRERAKARMNAFIHETFDWDLYKQDTGYRSPHETEGEDG